MGGDKNRNTQISTNPKDYPHSSYNYYAYGEEDGLTDRDPCYNELGRNDMERQAEYRRLTLDKQITSDTFKHLFMGTEGFVKKMEGKFGVNNIPAERGRPRKAKK